MLKPAATAEQSTFYPGALISGRYEVVRKLGAGGMGAVFLARMVGMGKLVALKVFGSIDNANLRRRFEREAALALEITHPGAAQVLDVGEHLAPGQVPGAGFLFIVMEYIEGDDISALLDIQGALSFSDARAIARSVAQTLAYAHHKGVVHRDIKPENIRVKRDMAHWQVKVLDFGIARVVDDDSTRLTHAGSITGTPRYMSPEQVRNDAVDGRADMYALGLVLFEMLTGRDPFARDSVAQVLWAQMNDPLPSISRLQPGRVSAQIDALLAKACAKLPDERFASAHEFLLALDAIVDPQFGAAAPVERRRRSTGGSDGIARSGGSFGSGETFGAASGTGLASSPAGSKRAISSPIILGGKAGGLPRNVTLGLLALALLLAGAALWVALRGGGEKAPVAGVPSGAAISASVSSVGVGDCAMQGVSAALANMPVAGLEQRASASLIMMPSIAIKQVKTLKLTAEKYPAAERDCMLRRMLAQSIEQESVTLATVPSLWGQTRSVADLKALLLSTPFRKNYDATERGLLIDKIETMFIANLQKDHPGDGDFWRRMYLGLLLSCEATEPALKALGVEHPGNGQCLGITPR